MENASNVMLKIVKNVNQIIIAKNVQIHFNCIRTKLEIIVSDVISIIAISVGMIIFVNCARLDIRLVKMEIVLNAYIHVKVVIRI